MSSKSLDPAALDETAVAAIVNETNHALGDDLTRLTPEALARLASWAATLFDEIALAQHILAAPTESDSALDALSIIVLTNAVDRALGDDLSCHPSEVLAHLAGWADMLAAKVALAQQQGGGCAPLH